MYCRQCGSEISNEAKFCNFCGTRTVSPSNRTNGILCDSEVKQTGYAQGSTNADSIIPIESNDLGIEPQTTANNDRIKSAVPPAANDELDRAINANAATATRSNNLKAAVVQNKKRSRRRIPMIVLVALALALATSVAYAAYRAYTDIWVPMQQEQQQKAQAEKDAQEAQDAYNGIIEEYTQALAEEKDGTLDYPADGTFTKYPDVNAEPLLSSGGSDYLYALKDLNNDGINELLIGKGAYRGTAAIYDIWSYQDGKLIEIEQGITREYYCLRENNVIMRRGNGGAQVNVYTMMTLNKGNLYDVNDLDDNGISKAYTNNWTTGESLEQDWPDDKSANGTMTKFVKIDASGNITSSGTCTLDQFSLMLDQLSGKYPEDTSVEWKTISAG